MDEDIPRATYQSPPSLLLAPAWLPLRPGAVVGFWPTITVLVTTPPADVVDVNGPRVWNRTIFSHSLENQSRMLSKSVGCAQTPSQTREMPVVHGCKLGNAQKQVSKVSRFTRPPPKGATHAPFASKRGPQFSAQFGSSSNGTSVVCGGRPAVETKRSTC